MELKTTIIEWRTWLPEDARPALQEVFYFNPRQAHYHHEIVETVKQFGDPQIVSGAQGVTLVLPKVPEAQCLFALHASSAALCGVVIFMRHGVEEMEILHLATCAAWQDADDVSTTTARLLGKILDISRSIRGVNTVRLPYGRGRLPVENRALIKQPEQPTKSTT